MKITEKSFGTTEKGEKATLYTVTNDHGMSVLFTDYGANIVGILTPDKNGKVDDITLGYDSVKGYEQNGPYLGGFIGRHANRIGGAQFTLNSKVYKLEDNDNGNNLHGGFTGYNNYMYEVETFEDEDMIGVEFSRLSPDMEQGFPGNLDVTVTYGLTNDNELVIEYHAVSDKDTIVNLTNHSYFNLSGHKAGSILDHKVQIKANQYTPTSDDLIPTGELRSVEGTPLDFRKMKTIGQDIDADFETLKQGGGYDLNYVLENKDGEVELVAELVDDKSGRKMEVFTDMPGLQLYSGNMISPVKYGKEGMVYPKRSGVCFETQFFPNSCNIKEFPSCVLKADQEYSHVTVYKFSTVK